MFCVVCGCGLHAGCCSAWFLLNVFVLLRSIASTRCCSSPRCLRVVLCFVNRPLSCRRGQHFDAHRGGHQRASDCGGCQDAPCAASGAASPPVMSGAFTILVGVSCGLPGAVCDMRAPSSDALSGHFSVQASRALLGTDGDLRRTSTRALMICTGAASPVPCMMPESRRRECITGSHARPGSLSSCRADSKRA